MHQTNKRKIREKSQHEKIKQETRNTFSLQVAVNCPVFKYLLEGIIIKECIVIELQAIDITTKFAFIIILILIMRITKTKNADRIIIIVEYIVVMSIRVKNCSSKA